MTTTQHIDSRIAAAQQAIADARSDLTLLSESGYRQAIVASARAAVERARDHATEAHHPLTQTGIHPEHRIVERAALVREVQDLSAEVHAHEVERHGPVYQLSRDGLADLGLPDFVEDDLRDRIADDPQIAEDIDTAVNAQIARHGVTVDGKWFGGWSTEEIVERALTDSRVRASRTWCWTVTIDGQSSTHVGAKAAASAINAYGDAHGESHHYTTIDLWGAGSSDSGIHTWGPCEVGGAEVTATTAYECA